MIFFLSQPNESDDKTGKRKWKYLKSRKNPNETSSYIFMIVSNYIQKYHQKEMTKYMSSLSVGIITIPNF